MKRLLIPVFMLIVCAVSAQNIPFDKATGTFIKLKNETVAPPSSENMFHAINGHVYWDKTRLDTIPELKIVGDTTGADPLCTGLKIYSLADLTAWQHSYKIDTVTGDTTGCEWVDISTAKWSSNGTLVYYDAGPVRIGQKLYVTQIYPKPGDAAVNMISQGVDGDTTDLARIQVYGVTGGFVRSVASKTYPGKVYSLGQTINPLQALYQFYTNNSLRSQFVIDSAALYPSVGNIKLGNENYQWKGLYIDGPVWMKNLPDGNPAADKIVTSSTAGVNGKIPTSTFTTPAQVAATYVPIYNNNKKIAYIGTSITASGTNSDATTTYEMGTGYFNWGNAFLGFPFSETINVGIAGNTTTQILNRFHTDVALKQPGYCFIESGVNDNDSATIVFGKLKQLWDSCIYNHIRPISSTVMPNYLFTDATRRQYIKLNQWIKDYSHINNIPCVDFDRVVNRKDTTNWRWQLALSIDGLHPNANGAIAMGREYANTISSIISPSNELPSIQTDNNLLTVNPLLIGTGGTNSTPTLSTGDIAANSIISATCTTAMSKVTRKYGEWQKMVISTSGTATYRLADVTTGFSVGDTIFGISELKLENYTGLKGIALNIRCLNSSNTVLSSYYFNYFNTTDPDISNLQTQFVLKTKNQIIPSSTAKLRTIVTITTTTGTFYIGRIGIKKYHSLSGESKLPEPYSNPVTSLKNTEDGVLVDGNLDVKGVTATSVNSGSVGVGTTATGGNVVVSATQGAEMAPALTTGNWTLTTSWSYGTSPDRLIKVTDAAAQTATMTGGTAPTIGKKYRIVITASATSGTLTYTFGGTGGGAATAITTAGVSDDIVALTTARLIITGAASSTATITSISIKEITLGTGDAAISGDLKVTTIKNSQGLPVMNIYPSGGVSFGNVNLLSGRSIEVLNIATFHSTLEAASLASFSGSGYCLLDLGSASKGTVVNRNIADAYPVFRVTQTHASSTGDIMQWSNSGGIVMSLKQGGALGVNTTAPATGTTIDNNGLLRTKGLAFQPVNTGDITAGTGITVAMLAADMRYNGSSAVNITANPQIADGIDGQEISIVGLSDSNTLTLSSGNGLKLAYSVYCALGAGDIIRLRYIASLDKWCEVSRTNAASP